MKALLRNPWVIGGLGVLAISLLIYFVGPLLDAVVVVVAGLKHAAGHAARDAAIPGTHVFHIIERKLLRFVTGGQGPRSHGHPAAV